MKTFSTDSKKRMTKRKKCFTHFKEKAVRRIKMSAPKIMCGDDILAIT
jgi:hypothetical protein